MANSIITYTGDGSTVQYAVTFTLGILDRSYVTCRVNNEVDGLGAPVYRTLEWVNDGLVNIQGGVPADGVPIVFTRTMDKDELIHDYTDGAAIQEENLDQSNLQLMMSIHEVLDGRFPDGFASDINMNGFKFIGAADATEDDEFVTLGQLGTSVSDAEASAAAAELAADQAEAARDATLAAFDSFDDRYLGTKTSNPTLDNDGNALIAGSLYFNSVTGVMMVYTGSAWVAAYVSGGDYLVKASNLADLTNVGTARTNLGLGTMATQGAGAVAITGGSLSGITDLAVADGGTGASTAANARTNLGLGIGSNVQAYHANLALLSTLTQGDILYASSADTLAKLAKGTALQQLRMNAGATAPEWATADGAVTLYDLSATASQVISLDFTTNIAYEFWVENMFPSAVATFNLDFYSISGAGYSQGFIDYVGYHFNGSTEVIDFGSANGLVQQTTRAIAGASAPLKIHGLISRPKTDTGSATDPVSLVADLEIVSRPGSNQTRYRTAKWSTYDALGTASVDIKFSFSGGATMTGRIYIKPISRN